MNPNPQKHVFLMAVFMLLAATGSLPALAEEAAAEEQIAVKPGVNALIERILADPHIDYRSVTGPDDCDTEMLYQGTRDVLGEYIAAPEEKRSMLLDYLLSGKAPCNCTRAIVGKDFNILVKDVGLKMSELPCLQLH